MKTTPTRRSGGNNRWISTGPACGVEEWTRTPTAEAYPEVTDPEWLDRSASDSTLYWDYRADRWRDERDGRSPDTLRSGYVSADSGAASAFGGGSGSGSRAAGDTAYGRRNALRVPPPCHMHVPTRAYPRVVMRTPLGQNVQMSNFWAF